MSFKKLDTIIIRLYDQEHWRRPPAVREATIEMRRSSQKALPCLFRMSVFIRRVHQGAGRQLTGDSTEVDLC